MLKRLSSSYSLYINVPTGVNQLRQIANSAKPATEFNGYESSIVTANSQKLIL